MHANLQFAATLIAILGGILFSRNDARRLEAKIDTLRKESREDITGLRREVREDLSAIRKEMSDLRGEFTRKTDTIVAMSASHAERLMKVEVGKQDRP